MVYLHDGSVCLLVVLMLVFQGNYYSREIQRGMYDFPPTLPGCYLRVLQQQSFDTQPLSLPYFAVAVVVLTKQKERQ
jgi:hypothetical protein